MLRRAKRLSKAKQPSADLQKRKSDISLPCDFKHVAHVGENDIAEGHIAEGMAKMAPAQPTLPDDTPTIAEEPSQATPSTPTTLQAPTETNEELLTPDRPLASKSGNVSPLFGELLNTEQFDLDSMYKIVTQHEFVSQPNTPARPSPDPSSPQVVSQAEALPPRPLSEALSENMLASVAEDAAEAKMLNDLDSRLEQAAKKRDASIRRGRTGSSLKRSRPGSAVGRSRPGSLRSRSGRSSVRRTPGRTTPSERSCANSEGSSSSSRDSMASIRRAASLCRRSVNREARNTAM